MNRNCLKYIAVAAMLCDHIALAFIGMDKPLGVAMRVIGRLTAPIMCYFLVEGFMYTRSKKNYGTRLFVFALVSQIPFSYFVTGKLFSMKLNMIFTLFFCFILLLVFCEIESRLLRVVFIIGLLWLFSYCDWGLVAPLWVIVFLLFRSDKKKLYIFYAFVCIFWVVRSTSMSVAVGGMWYEGLWQAGSLGFIPLLYFYNGQGGKTSKFSKWFFYWIYPAHILILAVIFRNVLPYLK